MKVWAAGVLAITLSGLAILVHAQSQQALQDAQAAIDRKDYGTALRMVQPLAQKGDPAAQSLLGSMHALGHGVPQSYSESTNWFRKAAAQNFAEGQYQLGMAYLLGQGTPQNNTEALNWLRKAAEQGHPDAQTNLGMMYAKGQGVKRSQTEAFSWFRKGAERGNPVAQGNVGF